MRRTILRIVATGLIAAAGPAYASTIAPVSATGSSAFSGYGAGLSIDQSSATDWASNSQGVGSFLNLDLGASYALTSFGLVDRVTAGSFNGAFRGGMGDFTSAFSLTYFADSSFTTSLASYSFGKIAPVAPTSAADFAFSGSLVGSPATQFVRYTVLASAGDNPGLSNITFSDAAVPEPATWGMMILGFGAMGFAMRRRAKVRTNFSFT